MSTDKEDRTGDVPEATDTGEDNSGDPPARGGNDDTRSNAADPASTDGTARAEKPQKEIGGRGGSDPTRYGDWEIDGRCVDF